MSPRTFVARGTALLALAALGLAACESKTVVTPPTNPLTVTVTPPSATLNTVGQKVTFVALVSGGETGQAAQGVNWTSSAPAVATVNATTGEVTAVANGVSTITAASKADATKSAAALVTVAITGTTVSVTVNPPSATIGVGGQQQFAANVTGGTGSRAVTWRSSNTAVATVDANGVATGVAPGAAQITAVAVADTTAKFNASLTVSTTAVVVQISPTNVSIPFNGTQQFTAVVTGGTGSRAVTWRSSNTAVATINASGLATAVAPGNVSITAVAVADTLARAVTGLTVNAPPANPTLTIAQIIDNAGAVVDVNNVFDQMNVYLNADIPAGTVVTSAVVKLNGNTVCTQTFTQGGSANASIEAAGVVQIICPIPTQQYDTLTGVVKYVNGTYSLSAQLIGANNQPLTTVSQTLIFNNTNIIAIRPLVASKGPLASPTTNIVYMGGDVTVTMLPVIYTPTATHINTISVSLCATPGGGGCIATRTLSAAVGSELTGVQTTTFTQASLQGNQGRFFAVATSTLLNAAFIAPSGPPAPLGITLDELAPFISGAPALVNGAWLNATSVFTLAGLSVTENDNDGVDTDVATVQLSPNASPRVWTTAPATALAQGEAAAQSLRARVMVCDAFQNCRNGPETAPFGIDLIPPVVSFVTTTFTNNAINPAPATVTVFSQDTGLVTHVVSGTPAGFFKIRVPEFQPATQPAPTKCLNPTSGVESAPSSGACPVTDNGVAGSNTFAFNLAATEAYDSVIVFSVDSAGNVGNTITRFALVDLTAPTMGGILASAPTLVGGTAVSFTTTVGDNVDLKQLDGTLTYGAYANTAAEATLLGLDTAPISAFGLPMVASLTTAMPINPFITSLQNVDGANVPTGTNFDASAVTLVVSDQVPLTATQSLSIVPNVTPAGAFSFTAAPLDIATWTLTETHTPASLVHPVSVTLTGTVRLPTGHATPFTSVKFYRLTGAAAPFVMTPVATVPGSAGQVFEPVTYRDISYSTTVTGLAAGTYRYVVVGLDAAGHGLVSQIVTIVVT